LRCANCCFNYALGRWKVWLASAETDDVFALCLQRFCLCVNGKSGRFGDGCEACRNTVLGVLMRGHACHAYTVELAEAKTMLVQA
jgi:hypothetical protein